MSWYERRYDDDRPRMGLDRYPVATFTIVGVTLAVSLLLWGFGGGVASPAVSTAIEYFGNDFESLIHFQIWRPITALFLHGDSQHLLHNMIFLMLIGFFLEPLVGRHRFVRIYFGFGIAACLSVFLKPLFLDPPMVAIKSIGASGAIMGLIAYFGSRYPRAELYLFGLVPLRAWMYAAFLVGADLLAVVAQDSPHVDHLAHLGGAFAGFVWGYAWPKAEIKWEERQTQMRRDREAADARKRTEDSAELDRILQKINEEGGMSVLNERERRFLVEQSARLKNRSR